MVPEILETIVEPVTQAMNRQGLEITEIRDISYGKKFRLKMLNGLAEINIYYGRNGFTIVKSAKCGTNEQLNEIAYRIACSIIYDFQNESTLNEYYKNMINRTDFEQGKFMN